MRIGINALYLLPGKVGGSEIYIRNLVKSLVKVDKDNEYFIFINKESAGVFEELAPDIKVILCPIKAANRPVRILWEQLILPIQVKRHQIDILLSAGMTSPFIGPATSILVILDLQHINQPKNFSWLYLLFLKSIIYLSAKTADGIITISQDVKQDIIRFYKMRPEKIAVIYLAADHHVFLPRNEDEIACVREKYQLPEHFVLYIASSLPHKNHERLFQAFKTVQVEVEEVKLVLIGPRDKEYDLISEKIRELGLQKYVVFLGWLPFEDIPLIYCAAQLFIYPSLHEGFGLPILEAMACGVPVVCSRIEPITEVAGDAAIFIDPYSPSDIAEGILSVLKDYPLRQQLIEHGFKRTSDFTWESTALNTLSFLNSYNRAKQ